MNWWREKETSIWHKERQRIFIIDTNSCLILNEQPLKSSLRKKCTKADNKICLLRPIA